jgi:exopolyphosphatase / guanosine-5'-triphosphate,3'-diphosphate pyrophosphatase
MIIAAIDIGSNAARLLVNEVIYSKEKIEYKKLNLVRVPLRLGIDVFETGKIGTERATMLLNTMHAFKYLMDAYKVEKYRACATSAMRDATNSNTLITKVKKEAKINIEIIGGDEEAMLVYENHIEEQMDKTKSYMYVDVGGGSTECTIFSNGKLLYKKSFNIGTIRLMKKQVTDKEWLTMQKAIENATQKIKNIIAIGSGGNINKLFSLSKIKDGAPLPIEFLNKTYKALAPLTVEQRMQLHNLREDRADVIVPALEIYRNVMKWCKVTEIYVPKIGLSDGLIHAIATKK